jgi:hypothetical protein
VTTLQPFQLKNNAMAKGSGNTPLAVDVSLGPTDFNNGAHYRLPWAVSRDLQTVAMSGKELYFRVTDSLLKDAAHGGGVQTGFDFECSMFDGTAVPYVIKSYDGAAGTLMGVFKPFALAGSAAATRGFLYFGNPGWTVSKEDPDQTFVNATSVLFLPSGIDKSGAKLNFDANLPTSDKVIVNPGALVDGSQVTGNDIERALVGDCGSFLISFLCQSIPGDVDNSPLTFGSGTGTTVIYLRHCFATPNGPHPTTDITNCWRVGFATGGKETDYETAQGTADQTLQHIVFRRVIGSRPELYINGVLSPFAFSFEDIGTPAILSSRLDFTNQKIIVGRGSVSNSRWWNGYIDCFKFFKDDPKTAAWALAEYSNLMDIDGGVIFGSPETVATSSVWGETIKIQADQLTSVDFKADKYSLTVGGTIALRASAPFDNPTNGKFSDQGANTVRYTNTKAVNPDNDGAVHLTNGVGNVIIPVRAKIITITPPPPGGYYKTPNIQGKAPVNAANRSELLQACTDIVNGAHGYSLATHYVNLTGDIGAHTTAGSDISINVGGSSTHPLIITCTNGDKGDTQWNSRPTIYNSCILQKAPWIWLYGLQMELLPTSVGNWRTSGTVACVGMRADNSFVTACHFITSCCVYNDAGLATVDGATLNYNWFEMCAQGVGADTGAAADFIMRNFDGAPQAKVIQNIIMARNRASNYATQIVAASDGFRCFAMGNGHKDAGRLISPGTEIAWNFFDCNYSHCMEFKRSVPKVHHNHGTAGNRTPNGIYTRGENSAGPTNPTASDPTPLLFANRVVANQANFNAGYWDIISYWVLDGNGNPSTLNLFPRGHQPGKDIVGTDGVRVIDCKCDVVLGWDQFEANKYTYDDLGVYGPVLIARHKGGSILDSNGNTVGFNSYPPGPGTATGTHPSLKESAITRQDSLPANLPVTPEDPPILSATLAGPGLTGKVWGT